MRRLVLMRHAKTRASHPRGDHSRELLPTGIQDAQEAGLQLRPLGLEHALVSTATRARQTFAALGLDITVEYLDDLYHEGTDALLRHIGETDPAVNGLLVVGHAPTIPALAAQLGNASDSREADRLQCWYPTSTFTEFTFDDDWSSLAPFELGHVKMERTIRR